MRKPFGSDAQVRRYLAAASVFHFIFLALFWAAQNSLSEKSWPLSLMFFAPQFHVLLPSLVLIALCLICRQYRMLIAQLVSILSISVSFLGFTIPQTASGFTTLSRGWAAAPGTQPRRARVMTYNIHFAAQGMENVLTTIKEANADIICLQEARQRETFEELAPAISKQLPGYHFVSFGELAIFSRYPIEQSAYYPVTINLRPGALTARLNVDGRELSIHSVHLSNLYATYFLRARPDLNDLLTERQKTYQRIAWRNKQANLLERLVSSDPSPYILAGDFNTPPRGVLYRSLTKHSQDAWKQAGWGRGATYPARLPLERIDHIWTGNGVKAESCRVLNSRASDHLPVVADITLP